MKREIFLVTHLSPSCPILFRISHSFIPFPSFIHSLTHSFGFPPSLHLAFFQSSFVIARSILSTSLLFLLLWRWRGCEKNSWKHNEISLPFAISFGFHMVEIVSRICVCVCVCNECRSWWPKEYECECEFVCVVHTHMWVAGLEDVWTCSRCHYRTTNNLKLILERIIFEQQQRPQHRWRRLRLRRREQLHTFHYSTLLHRKFVRVSVSVANHFRLNCI